MDINFKPSGAAMVVRLGGEIDHHHAAKVRETIDKTMINSAAQHLILDFSEVTFMDSSGIGVVLGRYKKVKAAGGLVVIVSCSEQIRNILNMAGIFSIIDYMDNEAEALSFLRRKEGTL